MARQVLYQAALFVVIVLVAEILIGSRVEGLPGKKTQSNKIRQNGGIISGQDSSKDINRIVGGEFTTIKEFPYQIALKRNGRRHCGGTLIGYKRQHVLTAAHCMRNDTAIHQITEFNIVLRSTNAHVLESGTIIRNVKKSVIHPKYVSESYQLGYDIAVLTLDQPVKEIAPAKLESIADLTQTDYDGQTAVGTGWGSILGYPAEEQKPKSKSSDLLKKVELKVISAEKCNALYKVIDPSDDFDYSQNDIILCTHNTKPIGTCQGDSGGPLFVDGVQVGITSNGEGCADIRYPELYTRVSAFREWINQEVCAAI